ncbi:2-amino-4-hydroxy-6-hydroxymethyldihydropteridine diphosphokinase [Bergeyella sp. RCAD1439]|uniref:2-amino-4-hydroxy-6- hydroxymethyldihydropteridine diphosphokinase n=1 Tax=Bergeyella anatis TaxID=3113737 RepID=UPI002E1812EE|nr:2-amino-4-hydroxy-6-hydroxymethyldihydropteridine diphosphokinase [Bergeyella sp. RCAD1439]
MSNNNVVLLLGSNLGDPKKNLQEAKKQIQKHIGPILKESQILETRPVEFASSNNFHNFALVTSTSLSPMALLKTIKTIEYAMGRKRDSASLGGYTDRLIDIDIVRYSGLVYASPTLKIPHRKHCFEREFSKILLKELD